LEGVTLFVSDLHLTYGEDSSRFSGLEQFISRNDVRNFVILGDLFNAPGDAEKILADYDGVKAVDVIFSRLGISDETVNVFFVKGSQAHDPMNFDLNVQQDTVSFNTIGKCTRFSSNETRIITIHGDEAFGGLHGYIVSSLTGRPYLEYWWKDLMDLDDEEWVIMGHSHSPDIDYIRRVANTGGWTDIFGFGPPKGRGILLINNDITLVKISDKLT
jgi:UDP-2,3-diacylglucosamine pyrophosphatase LpxH